MTQRAQPRPRSDYVVFLPIQTRWSDNDMYGHVNNVSYYGFFDTAVNAWLIGQGVLDPLNSSVIGLVVETGCQYFVPLSFPQSLQAGLRVARLGSSSVRYEIGIFADGADLTAAHGHFVHVYVDSASRRPAALPAPLRSVLQTLTLDRT